MRPYTSRYQIFNSLRGKCTIKSWTKRCIIKLRPNRGVLSMRMSTYHDLHLFLVGEIVDKNNRKWNKEALWRWHHSRFLRKKNVYPKLSEKFTTNETKHLRAWTTCTLVLWANQVKSASKWTEMSNPKLARNCRYSQLVSTQLHRSGLALLDVKHT